MYLYIVYIKLAELSGFTINSFAQYEGYKDIKCNIKYSCVVHINCSVLNIFLIFKKCLLSLCYYMYYVVSCTIEFLTNFKLHFWVKFSTIF